ncbi:fumarate hydratase [Shumkonia mesophila]|uniref:fumarate hydratase n=1 Tax=Shumkonia mesophila TaxID=2838854 RepID=UPI00293471AF|nr:fumarate hydratase [Shumkonia mesophila]
MSAYVHHEMFPLGHDDTPYRRLATDGVKTVTLDGRTLLKVDPAALTALTEAAIHDTQHLLRPTHLAQLRKILDDPEASPNDRFMAIELLKNAAISAEGVLPMCQDTGTIIVMGKKGENVFTGADDEAAIAEGILKTFAKDNLRYSQVSALDMFEEVNTGNNLPAQIEIYATRGDEYKFLFVAKGGGSANKTFLFQETKALLNPASLMKFVDAKIRTLGTAACPPYHLALVIGGTSAELTLKTVKLASTHYLDALPTKGGKLGQAFRDVALEEQILEMTQKMGIGAQFGGKYFCHDVRVIRLPRHGASCPVGLGVSCSADRQIKAKITRDGVFLEQMETDPAKYLPEIEGHGPVHEIVKIDLNQPMDAIRAELSRHPIKTLVSLSGPMIVARDIAHAKLKERLDAGKGLPQYFKDHPVYYAGPAKTPAGYASGSFGPTTAGRMDSYVDLFQANGGSLVMVAKGNRSQQVTDACKKHGGFYLASPGGPAARLAHDCIKKVECIEYPELGMEAVWRIEIEDFPAAICVDDKGNDFFAELINPAR